MPWRTEWKALQGRIAAIQRTFEIIRDADDYYGLSNSMIIPQATTLLEVDVPNFCARYRSDLPPSVPAVVERYRALLSPVGKGRGGGHPGMRAAVAVISGMEGEISQLLADADVQIRSLVGRAFLHLQRLIEVDADYRAKWLAAFRIREETCEALGGLHLLWHGIWGFKANAAGERTDLILGTTMGTQAVSQVVESGSRLVLTEWKRLRSCTDAAVHKASAQAIRQARLYSSGGLAAVELRSVRYVVLISNDRVTLPVDIESDGISYKHVNIAVAPSSPSKARGGP
ncbi:hypothetical protein [Sorangium cellulosum]|uniref:hypothetical protein n=1 Tax=Sorangium cellulosum TaxID=56 RepID=UPI0012FF94CF|nr:hypothetical protein [Sorangium cellulosum]